ncbi:MAG: DUF2505 family protein [bacterium]
MKRAAPPAAANALPNDNGDAMKFKLTHHFDVNTEKFEKLTTDTNLQDYIDTLPNLKEREDLEVIEDERYVRRKVRNFAIGVIPKEIRHVLKPRMLSWIEESVYDKLKHEFEWKITPYYFRDVFKCSGTYKYIDESDSRMRREIEGDLTISVPVIGPIAERYIIRELRKNFEAEYRFTANYIRKKLLATAG